MPFIGKNPTAGFANIVKDDFTPDGTTTVFTLSKQVATANDIAVFVGNVRQEPTDAYTVSGTTLTMSAAPATGVNFYVLHIAGTIESSVVPPDGSIGTAKLVNDSVTTAKIADGQVTSAKLDTNIDVAGTLDVTGATTLDSTLDVAGNLDVNGTFNVSDDLKFIGGATPQFGIGTLTPNRKVHVYGNNANGAEISLTNTDMSVDRRTMNWFMAGDKAIWRLLNDAGNAGGLGASLDWDGIIDATAFTGTVGTAYGMLNSTAIGDSNVPYGSWGTPNNTYYRWVLPKAGVYRLFASWRVRMWNVGGYIQSRLYNNTTSTVVTDINGASTTRMDFEQQGGTLLTANIQISHEWIISTSADNQDIHHQAQSTNNSTDSSIQSDVNGYNIHTWQRIG